jgi:hypothetical protein
LVVKTYTSKIEPVSVYQIYAGTGFLYVDFSEKLLIVIINHLKKRLYCHYQHGALFTRYYFFIYYYFFLFFYDKEKEKKNK